MKTRKTVKIILAIFLIFLCSYSFIMSATTKHEQRKVAKFNKIQVGGVVKAVLKKGDSQAIDIKVSGIEIEDIITKVDDNCLNVKTEGDHIGESILVTITYTELIEIKTSDAAEIKSTDTIKSDTLKIFISDAGDANLTVDVGLLTIDMKDAGNLIIKGKALDQRVVIHDSNGNLDNSKLEVASWNSNN